MKWPAFQSFLIPALYLLAIAGHAQTNSPDLWQNQNIYQIITDRFFDGDASNNNAEGNYDPAGSRGTSVHGGDFKGIEQKLDYIKALGATAIWISPVVQNVHGEFHGYAARDFYKVAPHWGTLADLQHLIQAAHARGILVIDDVVVNHGGNLVDSADPGYPNFKYPPDGYQLRFRHPDKQYPPPFDLNAATPCLTNLFHNNGFIRDFKNSTQVELGELSGLDDFRTESDYVRSNMAAIYEYWIKQAGFDAFRIDTVKHVEHGFWTNWCPAVRAFAAANGKTNFFMFGEVLDASDAKCGSYTGGKIGTGFALDSVLDYPLYFRSKEVFAHASAPTKQIEDRYAGMANKYDPTARNRLVTFLDNHDQPRFLSSGQANHNQARLLVALTFLYTSRGIPCLYYGTEQAFDGENDPYDREDMFAGQFEQGPSHGDNFNLTHPLFQAVAKLNNFRRLYPALRTGEHINLWNNPQGPGLLAYARRLTTADPHQMQELIVVLNTANSTQTLPSRPTRYPPGTELVNLFDSNETITVAAGPSTPPIVMPATSSKIFIAQSQLLPLDPIVFSVSPKHDDAGISTDSSITLQFSAPMDTNSVNAAFSTIPDVPGTLTWSAQDRLSFVPRAPGFPPDTLITIKIASSAHDSVSGNHLQGAFESRFRTAAPATPKNP